MAAPAQQPADNFFTRFTKFLLGKGGIIWEQSGFLIRSKQNSLDYSVVDDSLTREEKLTELNLNWRGGFEETDTAFRNPMWEVSWRGEPCRNYADWEGWENKPYVALNGNLYDGAHEPGGDVLGGFVYTPENDADPSDNVPWLYIITVSSGTRVLRKKVSQLNDSMEAWEDLGILPGILGSNTDQDVWPYNVNNMPLGKIRSMFAHPDGTEFVAVWGRVRAVSNLDPIVGTIYYRWTVALDGLSFTNTNADETIEASIDVIRDGSTASFPIAHSFTYPTGSGGTGSATVEVNDGNVQITSSCDLVTTAVTFRMGADYRPDGTLVFFDITVDCIGTASSSTITNNGDETFEGPNADPPRPDFWRHEWSRSSNFEQLRDFEWKVTANFGGFVFDWADITYTEVWEESTSGDAETSKILEQPASPGSYYWSGTPGWSHNSNTTIDTRVATGEWEYVELHLADLRYDTLLYTRIREKNLPSINLFVLAPVGDYEFTTVASISGVQTTIWPWSDCSPVGHANRGLSVLNYSGVITDEYLNLHTVATSEVFPVDIIRPIYRGLGTYPDDTLYSSRGLVYGDLMNFNIYLSRFVRSPDDETDNAVTHFSATNPKGGFVFIFPSVRDDIGENAIPPITDPELKLYGKFSDDVLALMNAKLAALEPPGDPIVLDQLGHKFMFVPE